MATGCLRSTLPVASPVPRVVGLLSLQPRGRVKASTPAHWACLSLAGWKPDRTLLPQQHLRVQTGRPGEGRSLRGSGLHFEEGLDVGSFCHRVQIWHQVWSGPELGYVLCFQLSCMLGGGFGHEGPSQVAGGPGDWLSPFVPRGGTADVPRVPLSHGPWPLPQHTSRQATHSTCRDGGS